MEFVKNIDKNKWHLKTLDFDDEIIKHLNKSGEFNLLRKGLLLDRINTGRKFLFGVNDETEDVQFYNVVSNHYVPIEHDDLLARSDNYIKEFCDDLGYDGKVVENVEYGNNGKYMFSYFTFEDMRFDVQDSGEVAFRILMSNGYGNSGILIQIGAYRFVCSNGLIVGENYAREVLRHFYEPEQIIKKLQIKLETFDKIVDKWRKWVNEKMTIEDARKYLENRKIAKRWLTTVLAIYEAGKERNKWAFYNAITYVLTHELVLKYKKDKINMARERLGKMMLAGL